MNLLFIKNVFNKEKRATYYFVIVVLVIVYLIFNVFAYIDIVNSCYIRINKDVLRGNKHSIKEAVRLIKKTDKQAYKDLCKYTDTISEKYCTVADPNVDIAKAYEGWKESGCYVKGSKIIYIIPQQSESQEVIKKRAEDIKKCSQMSKDFWLKLE